MSRRENKQQGIGHVIEYHAGSKIRSDDLAGVLESADIVLTTYHMVAKSYPKAIVPSNLVTAAQKDAWWQQHYSENRGILHTIPFYRVVLDEAQAIKNHKGHTSLACRAIDARHHWAITGTPILNTIREFYPYFKFLREPHTGQVRHRHGQALSIALTACVAPIKFSKRISAHQMIPTVPRN